MARLSLAAGNEAALRPEAPAPVVYEVAPLPPALELCLKRSLRAKLQSKPKQAAAAKRDGPQKQPLENVPVQPTSPSADALLLAEMKTKRQRELCAYQLLKWHEEQRQLKAVKVAAN